MKRLILPISLSVLLFGILAIPKIQLGLAVYEEKEWLWAKPIFVRVFIDFVFASIVATVIWMQLKRNIWLASTTFCVSTLFVSVFWISPLKRAPEAYRTSHAKIYQYIKAKPITGGSMRDGEVSSSSEANHRPSRNIEENSPAVLDEETLIQYFDEMIRALFRWDREFVVAHCDLSILDYFEEIKKAALEEGKEELTNRRSTDQLIVLSLRHHYSSKRIGGMTPQDVFNHAINYLHISIGSGLGVRIDYMDISEDGLSATADMVVNSLIPEDSLTFRIENGVWKISLLPLIPVRDELMVQRAFDNAVPIEELLMKYLADESERKPSPTLWDAPE